jgi:uncharacterized protein (DUF934 family)
MPRRLLRDGAVDVDDWRHLAEIEAAPGAYSSSASDPVILPFERWLADRERWLSHRGRLGVVLAPADAVERLASELDRFALIGADFPTIGEGRGYTQARLLRERYGFNGELRAVGYVRRDQIFFMARCGFNSFELPDAEIDGARSAFATFSAAYQSSNDRGLAAPLRHR